MCLKSKMDHVMEENKEVDAAASSSEKVKREG
jgi:hypothetical protein